MIKTDRYIISTDLIAWVDVYDKPNTDEAINAGWYSVFPGSIIHFVGCRDGDSQTLTLFDIDSAQFLDQYLKSQDKP